MEPLRSARVAQPRAAPRRRALRLALPAALSLALTWLLIGCGLGVYIPTPEQGQEGKRDFRKLVGNAKSSKPIRPLAVTRGRVTALLGEPDYRADDGRTVGYLLRTYKGYYFAPLCFQGTGAGKWYRLQLRFGPDDVLLEYHLTETKDVPAGEAGQGAR